MRKHPVISLLFIVGAVYDGVLGLVFLCASGVVFRWYNVTPPNHPGYVQFPAALLLIFALMFVVIALNPRDNRNLIPYGMLLKVAYCGVVAFHWLAADIPDMWKPFCVFDFVFLVLFALAWKRLKMSHV